MNKKAKIITACIALPLVLFLTLSIAFYLLITFVAPTKHLDWTVNVTELKNVEDNNNRVIYVEYYSNKNGNGVELLDIKINGYIDAEQINKENPITYAKGIQLVGTTYNSIGFDANTRYKHNPWEVIFGQQQTTYNYVKPNVKAYYYDTQNGISVASAEDLSADSIFKVSVGNDLYLMKLLGEDAKSGEVTNAWWMSNMSTTDYDQYYMSKIFLDICRTNSIGLDSKGLLTKSLGDLFTYKKYHDGMFGDDWLTSYDLREDNIIVDFTNNVTIQITTHSDGARKAQDSMFGIIEDKNDFEFIQEGIANDYFNGQQTLILNECNFDYINIVGNKYTLVLSQKTIEYIAANEDKKINIIVDLDVLSKNNIVFDKFDASLKDYKDRINTIQLKQTNTQTGEIIYQGVVLWVYF